MERLRVRMITVDIENKEIPLELLRKIAIGKSVAIFYRDWVNDGG